MAEQGGGTDPGAVGSSPAPPGTEAGLVLGVDGGNTKTVALVADREGRLRGAGRPGDPNIYRTTSPQAPAAGIDAAADGRSWRSGWWARHPGAWAMGEAALQAVYVAELGFAPTTSLTTRALEVFGCATVEEVLHAFSRRGGRHPYDTSLLAPGILAE